MNLNIDTENTTLNVKLRRDNDSERRNREAIMMALNAKLRSDDDGSERQAENVMMMTLNVEIGEVALNAERG